jgi:hypothetical protein
VSNPDQIQAPTTNVFGLPATPAVDLTPTGRLPYLVEQADIAREHADALSTLDFDKVTAAVHEAMQATFPDEYTPELGDTIAADTIARLDQARQDVEPAAESGSATTPAACTDNIAWCFGDPDGHADPREHRHEGREYKLNGSYLQDSDTSGIAAFQLTQWDDGEPCVVFQGTGLWPSLDLTQVDELIADAVPWLVALFGVRRRLAIEVSPNRPAVPFTESDDEQTASAAFDLATKAIDIDLAKTGDRAGTFGALRSFLNLIEAEQA